MKYINHAWTSRITAVLLAPLAVVSYTNLSWAQSETIPEAIARGASGRTTTEHSGKAPSVRELLVDADLVVRGVVGDSRSYLSSDKRDIYTDYSLIAPIVLFQRAQRTAQKPGQLGITLTQLGGKALVGNVEFTQTELGLRPLVRGTEGLFILELRQDGKYHIARTFYGAFGIAAGTVKPLTPKHDFAPEYRDMPVAAVLADLASQLQSIK